MRKEISCSNFRPAFDTEARKGQKKIDKKAKTLLILDTIICRSALFLLSLVEIQAVCHVIRHIIADRRNWWLIVKTKQSKIFEWPN